MYRSITLLLLFTESRSNFQESIFRLSIFSAIPPFVRDLSNHAVVGRVVGHRHVAEFASTYVSVENKELQSEKWKFLKSCNTDRQIVLRGFVVKLLRKKLKTTKISMFNFLGNVFKLDVWVCKTLKKSHNGAIQNDSSNIPSDANKCANFDEKGDFYVTDDASLCGVLMGFSEIPQVKIGFTDKTNLKRLVEQQMHFC
uniref:Uncharacterized protein n=1 Tax=Strigamia maritima TaxID=126957 RepID=T1J8Q2_STRMM